MKNILLIGATGFVGRVVYESCKLNGYKVVPSKLRLHQSTDWFEEVEQVDAVINTGGVAHMCGESNKKLMEQANYLGLLPLVQAFKASSKCRVFINLSSVAASGWTVCSQPVVEMDDLEPKTWYGQTKRAGEQLLISHSKEKSDKLVINLRPPLIFGTNAKGNFELFRHLVERKKWLPFGAVHNRRSLLSVRNLAEALVHIVQQDDKFSSDYSGNYFICDRQPVSLRQMVDALTYKNQIRQIKVPPCLLRLVLTQILGQGRTDGLLGDLIFDSSKLAKHFGWVPRHDTIQELRKLAG